LFVATGLALTVAYVAPLAGIAACLAATQSHAVIVDTLLPDNGTIDIIYAFGLAGAVDTDRFERIVTFAVVAALDTQAMLGLIGQAIPLVGTIAVRFTTRQTLAVYAQLADRTLILGGALDTHVSLLVTLTRGAVAVFATAFKAFVIFADMALAAIGILATTFDTGPFFADQARQAMVVYQALDTGMQNSVAVTLAAILAGVTMCCAAIVDTFFARLTVAFFLTLDALSVLAFFG